MARCVKLSCNQKDQNMDHQTYTESKAGMAVTCNTRIREAEKWDPWGKLADLTSQNQEVPSSRRDHASVNKVENS